MGGQKWWLLPCIPHGQIWRSYGQGQCYGTGIFWTLNCWKWTVCSQSESISSCFYFFPIAALKFMKVKCNSTNKYIGLMKKLQIFWEMATIGKDMWMGCSVLSHNLNTFQILEQMTLAKFYTRKIKPVQTEEILKIWVFTVLTLTCDLGTQPWPEYYDDLLPYLQ